MGNEIKFEFDVFMVLLSVLIAYVGSYLALSLFEQYRAFRVSTQTVLQMGGQDVGDEEASVHSSGSGEVIVGKRGRFLFSSNKTQEFVMLSCIAGAIGGIGIWAMHFISMAALTLSYEGERIIIHFNKSLTIVSLVSVILCTLGGLYIGKEDMFFTKSAKDVLAIRLQRVNGEGLTQRKFSKYDVLWTLLTVEPQGLVVAGTLTAVGIGIMHYVGMIGMSFRGVIHWYAGVIVCSAVLAVLVATIAHWVLFRLMSVYHHKEWLRVTYALVFAIAKCLVHYTGMAAATYYAHSPLDLSVATDSFSQSEAMVGALIATFFVSWCIVMLIFSDLRYSNNVLNRQVARAEDLIAKVKVDKRLVGATASIVNKYQFFRPTKAALLAATTAETRSALEMKEQRKAEELRAALQNNRNENQTLISTSMSASTDHV